MKPLLKKWSLHTRNLTGLFIKLQGALWCFLYFSFTINAQIANYINNGGFEECSNCPYWIGAGPLYAKYWKPLDTNKLSYSVFSELPPSQQVPQNGFAWQWPKNGHNYIITSLGSEPTTTNNARGYACNILKQNLQAGKTYCVKFYCNISNQSTYGVDGIGAYFGDSSIDTITQSNKPITYLTPQVQNQNGNIITDTLNWVLITGSFIANGIEKYMLLGNFKTDAATNKLMINPTNLPMVFTDVLFDDVSCIDIDLPAFAGYDYYKVPGDSAFIGRPPDVGINEACTWYQLPNMATPIATVAGMYVKPSVTTTYVVRQEICNGIKWDTVVIYQSAVGIENLKELSENLNLYPVPARDELYLQWSSEVFEKEFKDVEIINSLGQLCFHSDLFYDHKRARLDVKELSPGIYTLRLKSATSPKLNKRFVIAQ